MKKNKYNTYFQKRKTESEIGNKEAKFEKRGKKFERYEVLSSKE